MGNENETFGLDQNNTKTLTDGWDSSTTPSQDRPMPQNGSLEHGNLESSTLRRVNSNTQAVNPITSLGTPPDGGWAAWMSGKDISRPKKIILHQTDWKFSLNRIFLHYE
jgi:hypothetical protein